jgi:G3E family GTPase
MADIDIITGFLGAGKTTFANLLLNEYLLKNERAVFIVNEFGKTSLDAELIKKEGFDTVALSNGCICCSLKNDLALSLKQIIKTFNPTKIVFETSGIFIFNQFEDILKDEFLKDNCTISRTITIVDSINYKRSSLAAGGFLYNQIKNSSMLVISKLERFSGGVSEIICDLKNINPQAVIMAEPWNEKDFIKKVLSAHAAFGGISTTDKNHALMDSLTIVSIKDFTNEGFYELKNEILREKFGRIFRVKGTIRIEGEVYLLNIAMDDIVLKKAAQGARPILTFIGDKIDAQLLRGVFNN